ncbi:hypothetical protein L3X38_010215 [Prunus dulcis]|uniref:Uncharacterized protein n=1 Tax=Prunus dulcis TaxID=3755 RepID=A0AAD4ZDT8_PRUDU|nr:hypothetical protein L3X38_010215 [Prunus dulcis]
MSRRSLRTSEGESGTSRLPGQDPTSRSRREMEDASSVCSRLCYCGNVVKTHTSWTVSHPGRRFQVCARVLFIVKCDARDGRFVLVSSRFEKANTKGIANKTRLRYFGIKSYAASIVRPFVPRKHEK